MRTLLAAAIAIFVLCLIGSAHAERRMFIVASNPDGYGVDRCLESGEKCGAAIAAAYCKTHQFATAAAYHKVDRDEITGSIPAQSGHACPGCGEFVAIVCTR
ncbi:MAG: hypothetical protein OJF62_003227 [Pseudolabrys sp.]|jgi:hypothetical protein|nr:hypothetical protein [Pseudolabrys sp.]